MRRHKTTTTAREARGRERALATDPVPLALAAALDVLARHRATQEPLERVLAEVARQRRLGPRERRATGDLVFGWARRSRTAEQRIDDALDRQGGIKPPRRDRDLCALLVAQAAAGLDIDPRGAARLPPLLAAVVADTLAHGLPPEPGEALPIWLRDAITRSHPEPGLLASLAQPAPLVLAVDARVASPIEVVAACAARGLRAAMSPVVEGAVRVEGRFPVSALPPGLREAVWPMDDGSQAVARALGAAPGGVVLDLCAGGGGKTRLLVTTGARVVSADVSLERLHAAPSRWRVVGDGLVPPFRAGTFDRVLVDAPCSGTGTVRRAPDLAHRLKPEDIAAFQAVQRRLLSAAATLVKPGGLVVYATCSLLREENDDVVDAVLREVAGLRPAPLAWGDQVHIDGRSGRAHLTPVSHGTDGFFVAALEAAG